MTATVVPLTTPNQEDHMPTRPADPAAAAPSAEWRPLGLAEIADLLRVNEATPTRWKYLRHRTKFPVPDGHVSRTVPYWYLRTIEAWARDTGRWPGDEEGAARAAAAAAREAARREADLAATEADRLRDQLAALQRELADADAAAEEAARRAAAGLPQVALAG